MTRTLLSAASVLLRGEERAHSGDIGGSKASQPGSATRSPPLTVWEILHAADIDPAPRRSGPTWREFLATQAESIIAADHFHIDPVVAAGADRRHHARGETRECELGADRHARQPASVLNISPYDDGQMPLNTWLAKI